MPIGMFVAPIDDDTSRDTLEVYASYSDAGVLYSEPGKWKDYCDGQTSPTSPRYADDRSGMLWMHNPENAIEIQRILRQNVVDRVLSGELKVDRVPSWFNAYTADLLNPATVASVASAVTALSRDAITVSQAETAARQMLSEYGFLPADGEVRQWLMANRSWELFT